MDRISPSHGLGWSLLPRQPDHYSITPPLPRLSSAEETVAQEVLETFYAQSTPRQTADELKGLLAEYCQLHHLRLEEDQASYVGEILLLHAFEAGPLTPLLNDPRLEEIVITGVSTLHPVRVYVSRKGWRETPLYFTHSQPIITLFNRLTLDTGKRLSASTPILNAILPNGSRIHAAISPVCSTPIEASIRQFTHRMTRPEELRTGETLSAEALAFLTLALQLDCNVLIVGNTGSGKTTTLNALLGTFAQNERMILIEETPELHIPHPHFVRLIPHGETKLDMARLTRETLRMRPDRVIVGEIRFPEEAHAYMESILAGQGKGTLATFHGHSTEEAVARLHAFGILKQDIAWINIMVVQRRWTEYDANGKPRDMRGISEIAELAFDPKEGLHIHPLFSRHPLTGILEQKKESVLVRERFARAFPGREWETEWKKRIQFFSSTSNEKNHDHEQSNSNDVGKLEKKARRRTT